jgi:hypothetical protein
VEVEAGNQNSKTRPIPGQVIGQATEDKDSPVLEVGHSIQDKALLVLKHPEDGLSFLNKVLLIMEELMDGHQMLESSIPVLEVGKTNLPKVHLAPIKMITQSTGMDS